MERHSNIRNQREKNSLIFDDLKQTQIVLTVNYKKYSTVKVDLKFKVLFISSSQNPPIMVYTLWISVGVVVGVLLYTSS